VKFLKEIDPIGLGPTVVGCSIYIYIHSFKEMSFDPANRDFRFLDF